MPKSYSKCQFIDTLTSMECDSWYVSEENQCFCPLHRTEALIPEDIAEKKEVHIPRTVTVMNGDHIQALNAKVAECLTMSIPDLAEHIRSIEDKIKELERDRRAANIAKRNLEDRLTDEERAALREDPNRYKSGSEIERAAKPKKSPEEKAKSRKEGFSAWAARLGVKTEELMTMDDDEMAARIAKYKASKG